VRSHTPRLRGNRCTARGAESRVPGGWRRQEVEGEGEGGHCSPPTRHAAAHCGFVWRQGHSTHHVANGATPSAQQDGVVRQGRQPKVGDLEVEVTVQQDVLGLQVSVANALGVAVVQGCTAPIKKKRGGGRGGGGAHHTNRTYN
jgi:hypothetical protein